ncbi:trypsin-like peptidase domain-containing protein [Streptomyces sp. NPDC059002]|uniref:trypsin-like peptidase domain-containing protein n=1 Tax=Streptomyces sp. NPDC059002 TaxID=3346690 RepID=UPI0036C0D9F9
MSTGDGDVGLLDDLLMFTVQIRHRCTRRVVGAGLLAARDCVVTCAHVLEDAGIVLGPTLREQAPEQRPTVPVRLLNGSGWSGWARPMQWLHGKWRSEDGDDVAELWRDDIAVLHILGEPPGDAFGRPMEPGGAGGSRGHTFRSAGFPYLTGSGVFHINGRFMGRRPGTKRTPLMCAEVQLRSDQLPKKGMSGAPVLDERLNRVVGLVQSCVLVRKWLLYDSGVAWAVDCTVLALPPLSLPVRGEPRARQQVPRSLVSPEAVSAAIVRPLSHLLPVGQAEEPDEFLPREEPLRVLCGEMDDPERRMIGLIGFGGEGKSSLAREVVRRRRRLRAAPVVWWSFDAEGGPELFFETALEHFTHGRLRLGPPDPSPSMRMDALSVLAEVQPCVFVLDGVEAVQERDAAGFGRVADDNLRTFLQRFASTPHPSFCLLTSRLPFRDLLRAPYSAYREHTVGRLTAQEGRALLRDRGVRGPAADLDALVEAWRGHALSLDLIGRLVRRRFGGDLARAPFGEGPDSELSPDAGTSGLLDFYDGHLSEAERTALAVLAAFRGAVGEDRLGAILGDAGPRHLPRLDGRALDHLLDELNDLGAVHRDERHRALTLHPLLRHHYRAVLASWEAPDRAELHQRIADACLRDGQDAGDDADLVGLVPLIEAVHHLCGAGHFDAALRVYRQRLELGSAMRLSYQLNAYETVSALLDGFWPTGRLTEDPALPPGPDSRYVVNRKAVSLMNTGRLAPASALFERAVSIGESTGDLLGATHSAENLAEVSLDLGELEAMAAAARRALELARALPPVERDEEVRDSSCHLGTALALMGRRESAARCFDDALRVQRTLQPDVPEPVLMDIWGIAHAEFLRRCGDRVAARRITEANLRFAEDGGLKDDVSICHRLLGLLEADDGRLRPAWDHLRRAVDLAREISERTVLLEALSARARFGATSGSRVDTALVEADLTEALDYAVAGGYALRHIDLRISGAHQHICQGRFAKASDDLNWARLEAGRRHYAWGLDDVTDAERSLADATW